VLKVIPGNDLAVPCAVDLDKTLRWISGWGNQAYWAVNGKEFLESLETENENQKILFSETNIYRWCTTKASSKPPLK